ncbi:hypothetical protein L6164_013652 [Bauhinia variegata]|uniref:Uncharacterized protein n=1 Tax=Bauhinia variegata TaxID=167791 RepID=A0ACB9NFL8_BAUVA|nr:hypothetical protein L6164_013652 [Bauhinia variegata]
MADFQQKLAALKGLVGVVNSMDDGENANSVTQANPSINPTTPPGNGKNPRLCKYSNTGTQRITGLTNQTGYTEGNANGVINFGNLDV